MEFLGIGPFELFVVLILALIVFGPQKLPEIGAGLGRALTEFRRASAELTQELTKEMNETSAAAQPAPTISVETPIYTPPADLPAETPAEAAPVASPPLVQSGVPKMTVVGEPHPVETPAVQEIHPVAEPLTEEEVNGFQQGAATSVASSATTGQPTVEGIGAGNGYSDDGYADPSRRYGTLARREQLRRSRALARRRVR